EPLQDFVERLAMKRLEDKNAFRFEHLAAKIDRGPGEFECSGLVHVPYPRQIRRQVRKNYVCSRARQGSIQALRAEIALQQRHRGDGGDRQKINRDGAAPRSTTSWPGLRIFSFASICSSLKAERER